MFSPDSIRQADRPAILAAIHAQDYVANAGRMVNGIVKDEEIRAHLRDRHRVAVDQQSHLNIRRMPTSIHVC